jgi:hypothetical protein
MLLNMFQGEVINAAPHLAALITALSIKRHLRMTHFDGQNARVCTQGRPLSGGTQEYGASSAAHWHPCTGSLHVYYQRETEMPKLDAGELAYEASPSQVL